ncbi:hypothetical protein SLEP1_g20071 [Rubroshorea leprosula]|uniref:Uncharacterized protein n=1 Tax=Rubroshorea leprosula TaxID=152421 RepID=A0AAV5J7H2_9ROSI|nr:hypothetical protein SLEP1_g20071 [Rubroshorea leprosula]
MLRTYLKNPKTKPGIPPRDSEKSKGPPCSGISLLCIQTDEIWKSYINRTAVEIINSIKGAKAKILLEAYGRERP